MSPYWLHHRVHHLFHGLALAVILAAQSAPGATSAPEQERRNGQQPCDEDAQGESKVRQSCDVYTDLARATGGFAYHVPAEYLDQITDTILIFSDGAAQSLIWVTGSIASPSTVEIPVAVDSTVQQLDFIIGTYAKESAAMELRRPDNTVVTRDEFAKFTSIPTLQHLRLLSPESGRWTVRITGDARFELSVMAKSDVRLEDVCFFPLISDGETLGAPRIGGALPVQQKLQLEVGMVGIRAPVAMLMLFDGTIIETVALRAYKDDPVATRKRRAGPTVHPHTWYDHFDEETYYFAAVFFAAPTSDFRVAIAGKDTAGMPVTRLLRRVFDASDPVELGEPEPTPEETEQHRKIFLEILQAGRSRHERPMPPSRYLGTLSPRARLALARAIANDRDATIGYSGCQILIEQGGADEAVPILATMIVDGRAETQLNGRMGYDWIHSGDDMLFTRMMLAISKHLLAHLDDYNDTERSNAEMFLVGPRLPFSTEAAQRRIDDMEATVQEVLRRTEAPTDNRDD